jgi:hypothetical protein
MTAVLIIIAIISFCWYFAFFIDYKLELFYETHIKSFLDTYFISTENNGLEKFSEYGLQKEVIIKNDVKSETSATRLRNNLKTLNYLNILEFSSDKLLCPERITEIRELKKNVQREVIRNASQIQNRHYSN